MANDQRHGLGSDGPHAADRGTAAPAAGGAAFGGRATDRPVGGDRAAPAGEQQPGMDDLKREARHAAEQVKERGKTILAREKDDAAGTLDSVADAFRNSADRLDAEQPRRYLGMAADRLESLGHRLRDKDIDSLIGDAQDAARRAPVAFFAGSVITGFLLARFMKSSAERRSEEARDPRSAARQVPASDPAPQGFDTSIASTISSSGGSHA